MLNLTKDEIRVIIFIIACFLIGCGVNYYKKASGKEAILIAIPEETITININSASIDELVQLKGIGRSIASRIVEFRKTSGPFFSKEGLMHVKGIGKGKFNSIKDSITISE